MAENAVVRDVRLAWLDSEHAGKQIRLTSRLLDSANSALELAQARFGQGLSSMVELNQAELAQTAAAIAQVDAEYEYRVRPRHSRLSGRRIAMILDPQSRLPPPRGRERERRTSLGG